MSPPLSAPGHVARGHVLLVFDSVYPFNQGGAELRFHHIGQGLRRRGWRVTWVGAHSWEGPAEQQIDGIALLGVGRPPAARTEDAALVGDAVRTGDARRRSPGGALRFCAALALAPLPADVDCIIAGQTPWLHYFVLRLRTRGRTPIIVDCWEIWGRFWRDYYGRMTAAVGARVERAVLRRADRLAAISTMTLERVLGTGVEPDKVFIAANGVDTRLVAATAPHVEASDVVYLGRLVAHKNVDVLIRAIVLVRRRHPAVRLAIIGDGPEETRLAGLVRDLDLAGNVCLLGGVPSHEEAMARLKASKLFVQPSTSEGGGSIAVLEAHACGLPVIAVRHPQGIDPGLIIEGVSGAWIEHLSVDLLAERIAALLDDPALLARMSAGARSAAADSDWDRVSAIYDEVVTELCRTRRR